MSDLLRRPAVVPALFSRAMDGDLDGACAMPDSAWNRLTSSKPLLAISGWAAVMLIDIPLVKAASAIAMLGGAG